MQIVERTWVVRIGSFYRPAWGGEGGPPRTLLPWPMFLLTWSRDEGECYRIVCVGGPLEHLLRDFLKIEEPRGAQKALSPCDP